MTTIRALAVTLVALLVAPPALADEAPDRPVKPSSFGAEPTEPALPAPKQVAPGDYKGMLENCDLAVKDTTRKLEACTRDATGIGFLGAAYLALWAILMAFFIMVRSRQKKLVAEMQQLRERLARLTDGEPR